MDRGLAGRRQSVGRASSDREQAVKLPRTDREVAPLVLSGSYIPCTPRILNDLGDLLPVGLPEGPRSAWSRSVLLTPWEGLGLVWGRPNLLNAPTTSREVEREEFERASSGPRSSQMHEEFGYRAAWSEVVGDRLGGRFALPSPGKAPY